MNSQADVIVAGTGLVGMVAALALANAGFRVAAIGPDVSGADKRTTAIMMPGLRFLQGLGLADTLKAAGAPLRAMRIIDGTGRLLRTAPVTFRASEIGEDAFGWNVPNAQLIEVLGQAVATRPLIVRHREEVAEWALGEPRATARLRDSAVEAPLVVAADGRNSAARRAAGIAVRVKALPQHALVVSFGHSRGHDFTSNEFHTQTGPFTQVPLPGNRSSLVWVERPERAAALNAMADDALSAAVEAAMQSMLGRIAVEPGRQVYPLSAVAPLAYGRSRVVLAGEAAHTIPPIGAQGLNLGLGDVRDLVDIAVRHRADPGSRAALEAYGRARGFAVGSRSSAVNLLNASLLSDFPLVQAGRSLGLAALRNVAPLRALFMREGLEAGGGLGLRPPDRSAV